MKKTLILSLIYVLAILSFTIPIFAGVSSDKLVLDTDNTKHQAFKMQVDSVASDSPLQGFCVGWTFTFTSLDSSMSTQIYVPLSEVNTSGGSRTYIFPVTTGWTKEYTGIAGGKSIRDLATYKWTFDQVIKNGCTVHADARIQKYRYSNGSYTPMGVYADSKAEIDSNFSEFTSTFKSNTKSDYFDLNLALDPEPPPTPVVTLINPEDGITVPQGTTVTFEGTGKGVHHIAGYVDGKYIGQQLNPNEDIAKQMTYSTTVTLDEVRDYTFQIKGRNTESEADPDSILKSSNIHTVHVIATDKPESGEGTVSVICLNQETNAILRSKTMNNKSYNTPMTEIRPDIPEYTYQGSQLAYNGVKGVLKPDISQTITLTPENKNATLYFFYKSSVPPVKPEKPEPPRIPQYHWWNIASKHTGSDFQNLPNDWNKKMPAWLYSKTDSYAPTITSEQENANSYTYSSENIYPILETTRNAEGKLIIDTSKSYAICDGRKYEIGKKYTGIDSGLDYGLYIEIDDSLKLSQYLWNETPAYQLEDWNVTPKDKGNHVMDAGNIGYGAFHEKPDFHSCTYFPIADKDPLSKYNEPLLFSGFEPLHYIKYTIVDGVKTEELQTVAINGWTDEELDKYPKVKENGLISKNINRWVNFSMNDSNVFNYASHYRLTLVLYTPDEKYNAVTKTITR